MLIPSWSHLLQCESCSSSIVLSPRVVSRAYKSSISLPPGTLKVSLLSMHRRTLDLRMHSELFRTSNLLWTQLWVYSLGYWKVTSVVSAWKTRALNSVNVRTRRCKRILPQRNTKTIFSFRIQSLLLYAVMIERWRWVGSALRRGREARFFLEASWGRQR